MTTELRELMSKLDTSIDALAKHLQPEEFLEVLHQLLNCEEDLVEKLGMIQAQLETRRAHEAALERLVKVLEGFDASASAREMDDELIEAIDQAKRALLGED